MTSSFHCPYQQASLLQRAMTPDKMRVAFFVGAGCPTAIQVPDAMATKPLIPDIAGLTKQVAARLGNAAGGPSATFEVILKRLQASGKAKPNIEDILSHIRSLQEVVGAGAIDGLSGKSLVSLDTTICKIITDVVSASLPSDSTPYHHLAAWSGGVRRDHPIEIFTPNYDLLTEQALENQRIPYFDGFVGSDRTFFDLASMEQDKLPPRWARLWKIHGSINWWRTAAGNIERHTNLNDGAQQMIHPSHLKYDESRRMPYLAMLDRLRNFLMNGQAVLITCGYSFSDRHINDIIIQGLAGNSTAVCFALLYADRAQYPAAVTAARSRSNFRLLAVDGAVLNTIERDWHSIAKTDHPLHSTTVQTGDMGPRTSIPADRCKLLLGDFATFGLFLAQQLDSQEDIGEEFDAK